MLFKFAFRRNLIYPLQLIIWHYLRKVTVDLIDYYYKFENSLSYTPIVFFGEIVGGLTFYLFQKLSFKRKSAEKDPYFMSIKLIQDKAENALAPADNYFKIAFLIFVTAYIDLAQFLYWAINIPKFVNVSKTLISRLSCLSTIAVAIFYICVLKTSIYKHQKFSLIVMGICFLITFGTEYLFHKTDIFLSYGGLSIALILVLFKHILAPIIDLLEKYLFEYDHMNPFLVLMFEGIVGFSLSFLFYITPNYLDDIYLVLNERKGWDLFRFIFLVIFYIICSALRNAFKMVTIKLYSPITRTLSDNVLTPLYLIVYFIIGVDFEGKKNMKYFYFIVNLILSLIVSFSSFIYSEFIVLFCLGLETNTHDQVVQRALTFESIDKYNLVNIDGESENSSNYDKD